MTSKRREPARWKQIRSANDALAFLSESPEEEPKRRTKTGAWDTLDADVTWRRPEIKVCPFKVRGDRAVFAQFAGQEWVGRPGMDREGCLFWGLLKRAQDDTVTPAQLTVAPVIPDVLTWRMLRSVSPERIVQQARETTRDYADWLDTATNIGWKLPPPAEVERIKKLADEAQRSRTRRGRRGNSPEFYRAFAIEALEEQRLGNARGLRGRLAKRRSVSIPTVRDWLRRARDLEFLAEAEWGKAGVAPGPRLNEPA
jgi:hypothetical protein